MTYVLSIPSVDTIHALATFTMENGGVAKILFPPFIADNPAITFKGNNIHNLKLTNAIITEPLGTSVWLGDMVQSMLVNSPDGFFSVEYDVTFPYGPNGSLALRTILPGRYGAADGYFQGNYVFCVPAYGTTKASWWRKNIDGQVSLSQPAVSSVNAGSVHGIPLTPFACYTIYELFFLQWAVSANVLECGSLSSSIVALSANRPLPDMPTLICGDLANTDGICAGVFPPPAAPRTVILEDSGSGMEGTFSFYMINWQGSDYTSSVRAITTHEALHAWIGIRTGELDDPWWKEGTASYLGRILAANAGFPKETLRPQLVKSLRANPMTGSVALSDPYVRDHLYDRDTNVNCIVLVYDKGAQACMLLDKMLRHATKNTATLLLKTGELCTRYDHSAFSRAQFRQVLEDGTGLDLGGFLSWYIDSPGFLDTSELGAAWRYLDSCGAFDSAGISTDGATAARR